jgi:hypothetical protein
VAQVILSHPKYKPKRKKKRKEKSRKEREKHHLEEMIFNPMHLSWFTAQVVPALLTRLSFYILTKLFQSLPFNRTIFVLFWFVGGTGV